MSSRKIILSVEEFHELYLLENSRVIDVQFSLGNELESRRLYETGHIPGAVFLNLETDLSGEITEETGRHPLPLLEDFVSHLKQLAITPDLTILVYDNFNAGAAARVWWMLTTLGYDDVYVLEGGISKWDQAGFELTHVNPTPEPVSDLGIPIPNAWEKGRLPMIHAQELNQKINASGNFVLVDSRNRERYKGLESGPDNLKGHITGAINIPWAEAIDNNGELFPEDHQRSRFKPLTNANGIVYCGSGVAACFNIMLAAQLDLPLLSLYPGSFSEWERKFPNQLE